MKIEGTSAFSPKINPKEYQVNKIDEIDFKNALQKAYDQKDEEKLREACRDFEKVFLTMMYKQMKATVSKSELIPESFAQETFESMLDEEFASKASEGQGIGLGDMLYRQLSNDLKNIYTPLSSNTKLYIDGRKEGK
ncbi:MAG: peptidoglycan hydrolase FlgJ [Clostridiales bacterium]|jgi:flagellar protein FlgJ|nr:peptidoglycan hydrolase FlgJ [Clostridiales bacterium]MDK2933901.1 peptidoglycan hydrolase FlgJ [Clostridiales bacterium]